MKKISIIFWLTFLTASLFGQSDSSKTKAQKAVEQNLTIIYSYVQNINSDSRLRRVHAIFFLERITKIESESDGTYFGKLDPTEADYIKWESWYDRNKQKIYWNDKTQTIVCCQEGCK